MTVNQNKGDDTRCFSLTVCLIPDQGMLNSLSHYIQRIKRHASQYQYVSFTEKNVLLTPLNTPRLRKKYLHQLLILNIKFRDVHRHVMFIFGSNQNDSKINLHFKSVIICARPYINIQRRHFEMPKHQSNARTFFLQQFQIKYY